MKLIITGGHLIPALAVIDEVRLKYPLWEIVFVGRTYAMEGDRDPSEEYRKVHEKNIRFLPLTTGRLERFVSRTTIISLFKLPFGFIQAFYYCFTERPSVIASFGGYVALPIVIAGWFFRIPTITHEQTLVPGLANRIISFFASAVCVNSESVARLFRNKKVVITGAIIRTSLFTSVRAQAFTFSKNKPLLYITGGTTGSQSVNELVYPIIPTLLQNYTIIHQVGPRSLNRALYIREKLTTKEKDKYMVLSYLDEEKHVWAIRHAHIVVGRSGANITAEIEVLGKVAVLIPLPWSSYNEQFLNAKRLADAGSSLICEQKNANPQKLLHIIQHMEKSYSRFYDRAQTIARQASHDGVRKFVYELSSFAF